MKKIIKLVMCLIVLMFFTACNKIELENNNDTNIMTDAIRFKEEYEALNESSVVMNIDENNPIKYIDFEELEEILTSGTGVIYFGFPGCPWCRNIIPVLFDVAEVNKVDTIYYVNPRTIKNNNIEDYNNLVNMLGDYLTSDEDGNKILYVPDVYFVSDGKIVGNHLSTVESQESPYTPLNDEQKKELENIYQELFDKIK